MTFYPLEKIHRLYDGYQQAFTVAGKDLLLIQDSGEVFLLRNACPHLSAPLTYASINNGVIRCPMHGIDFQLRSGCALLSPIGPLEKFEPVYEGNQLGILC